MKYLFGYSKKKGRKENRSSVIHTELVAFFVVSMEEHCPGLKHPPGNWALRQIWGRKTILSNNYSTSVARVRKAQHAVSTAWIHRLSCFEVLVFLKGCVTSTSRGKELKRVWQVEFTEITSEWRMSVWFQGWIIITYEWPKGRMILKPLRHRSLNHIPDAWKFSFAGLKTSQEQRQPSGYLDSGFCC